VMKTRSNTRSCGVVKVGGAFVTILATVSELRFSDAC
jgi:hypothetical protein